MNPGDKSGTPCPRARSNPLNFPTTAFFQSTLAPLAFTVVLAVVLGAAWRAYRQRYLVFWAGYWAAYVVAWPMYGLSGWAASTHARWLPVFGLFSSLASWTARILLLLGVSVYLGWRWPTRRALVGIVVMAIGLAVGCEVMRVAVDAGRAPDWALRPFRAYFLSAIVMTVVGLRMLRRADRLPRAILGFAILLFGLSDAWDFSADFLFGGGWQVGPAGLGFSFFVSQVTDAITGAGMLVAAIDTERDRAETAVDELRQREEQLGHMRKLEAAGQLAGGLAHDFNNLLTVIVASLEFVRDRLPQGDRGHHDVDAAALAADRAARLTRQLLTFARRQPVEPRVTNLTASVTSLDRVLAALVHERVERRTALAHDLWNVFVDPAQIEQVLVNLVVNSRDAMPAGGLLTIETRNVRRDDRDLVMLAVEDTGSGMDAVTKQRMFEPFFTTKTEGKGTGLGLSTVYGIVQQAGGTIDVHSAEGKGTRFEIFLPRCLLPETARSLAPELKPRGSEHILLVENEAGVRSAAARALSTHGYSVLEAEGGEAALKLALENVALAVVDIVMPGMDGWELGRELRKRRPDQRLLFISGFVPSPDAAFGLGTASFLPKPFTPDQLVRRVREVLDGV